MDDYNQIKQNFLSELQKAASNQKSSLSFIRNVLPQKPLVINGTVQAIVVGGTNYVTCLAKITDSKAEILHKKTGVLPVFKSRETFSTFLNEVLDANAQAVGLNFAFPLDPVVGSSGQLDGVLIGATKEHTFEGLIGHSVGDFVSGIFFTKYQKRIPVTVGNDSVCLTLSGNGTEDAGLIVGTGINLSLKIQENWQKSVVNLELGNFAGFPPPEVLETIDRQSEHPGTYLFEKSISGKYLADCFNETAGLNKLNLPHLNSSEDLSLLAETSQTTDGDLARSILERSASLIACALTGTYEFRNKPEKMEFITEGSLFWKGYKYLETVEKMLTNLGVPENTINFKYVEDSSLKGALGLVIN